VSPSEELVRTHKVGNAVVAMHVNAEPKDYGRLAPVRHFAGEGIVNTMLEQVPDRASRVTLGKEADAYGMRRSHLHWALAAADRRTARVLAMQLAATLARLDVGRMQVSKFISDPDDEVTTWFHAHQMGTTRMSRLPKDGVVDADCRVHTVGNLYLAGASVFPTGGGINPTLTLVMLALRLGKHLRNAA
jgi:choline dehydrogenase-like flavoprotein